jgi:hypothetical protein
MRLLSKVLWFLAFLVATFCWMVLFEHGFSMKSFTEGVRAELRDLAGKVAGGEEALAPPAPPEPPTAQPGT